MPRLNEVNNEVFKWARALMLTDALTSVQAGKYTS